MKLIAFEQVEDGGLILHTPAGKRKVFAGTDVELGELVRTIVADESEPTASMEGVGGAKKKPKRKASGVMGAGPRGRGRPGPNLDDVRDKMPRPHAGESADNYVNRLAGGAFQSFWGLLQRASDS